MENRLAKVIKENKDLQQSLKNVSTKKDAYNLISPLISDYTEEDMLKDLKEVSSGTELSNEELEAVAGGTSMDDIYISDEEFFGTLYRWFKKIF